MAEKLLELEKLAVSFATPEGEVEAVRGVDLAVEEGEILCLVGESGCGKTVTCHAVMHLLPSNGFIKEGTIKLCGQDITHYGEREMRALRGGTMSMIFQDPLGTLNPTMPIGQQIMEVLFKHQQMTRQETKQRALEMLSMVGIEEPEARFDLQPHFFSGGMRQRCVIAAALAANPRLLFADEATTALDVTVKARILDLLLEIRRQTNIAIVFVTHDLGSVARIADRVAVMYAGKIVEVGTAEEIFYEPRHPYTWALLSSLPQPAERDTKLYSITGTPPSLYNKITGDAFAPRNPYCLKIDTIAEPPMFKVTDTHYAKTWLLDPRAPKIEKPEIIQNIHEKLIKSLHI